MINCDFGLNFRFSSFIQGEPHLNDSEMMAYAEDSESEEQEFTSSSTQSPPGFSGQVSNGHNNSLYTDDDDSD